MDTSKEYIKMCDCPEIQENQIWESWGWYISRHDNSLCNPIGQVLRKYWTSEYYLWLPRQDQIQEMLGFGKYPYLESMEFSNAVCGGSCSYLPSAKSFEQLWLRFYMYEKHKKKWSGKEWVKK